VIPQRNISLLSNRLVADGGRRIWEDVLERDYCLAWFLAVLSQSDLKTVLGFKGGTALKRCYFGDYRFSEDLDFTLLEAIPFEEILGRLEPVYRGVRDRQLGGVLPTPLPPVQTRSRRIVREIQRPCTPPAWMKSLASSLASGQACSSGGSL
jgi:Nucleotidyl transferase AbiEii toxin, Type IV TA system